jgi:DNA (cytosine-5)-methyltransferase 1
MPLRLTAHVNLLRRLDEPPRDASWVTTRDAIAQFPTPVDGLETEGVLNHKGIPGARIYRGHTGGWIDWPAKTLKAGVHGVCGGEAMIRFSDNRLRYLTVREAAAIQGFPNSFEFPDVRTVAMRLIGNAVATTVAETIGRDLYALVNGTSPKALPTEPYARIAHAVDAREAAALGFKLKPASAEGSQELW